MGQSSSDAGEIDVDGELICRRHFDVRGRRRCQCSRPKMRDLKIYEGKHHRKMFSKLDVLRKSEILTDTLIVCGRQYFQCHSIVLLARSYYFKNKIMQGLSGSNTRLEIEENEIHPVIVSDLLNFIYNGEIDIPKDKLQQYVAGATKWQLHDLTTSQKVTLSQYIDRKSTSLLLQEVFTQEEMLSPVIRVTSEGIESDIHNKLVTFVEPKREEFYPPANLTLCTESGETVECHRELVASFGEYFYAMFGSLSFCESYKNEVVLQGIEYKTLRLLVDFLYSSKIELSYESAKNIAVASKWMILDEEITKIAETHLMDLLSYFNCLDLSNFAAVYSLKDLLQEAERTCFSHCHEVMSTEELRDLTVDEICEYLSSDRLAVKSEQRVFYAVLNWDQGRYPVETLERVLNCVRTWLIPPNEMYEFEKRLLSETQFSTQQNHKSLRFGKHDQNLRDCYKTHVFVVRPTNIRGENSTLDITRITPSTQISESGSRETLFTVTGHYNIKPGYGSFCNFCVAAFKNQIFITGGQDFEKTLSITIVFNPEDPNNWYKSQDLLHTRHSHHMVAVDDCLYVIGGRGKHGCVTVIEKRKFCGKRWVEETILQSEPDRMVCAAWKSLIYIFDWNDCKSYASLRSYNTKERVWSQVTILPFSYSLHAQPYDMIVLDDMIYIIGNQRTDENQYQVSSYDPSNGQWLCGIARDAIVTMCRPFVYNGALVSLENMNDQSMYVDAVVWKPPIVHKTMSQKIVSLTSVFAETQTKVGFILQTITARMEKNNPF